MILRSHHKLSKTSEGHEAWRSQVLPGIQRQVLARLREPMTVKDLIERLPNVETSELTEVVGELASRGWVLVEEPPVRDLSEEGAGTGTNGGPGGEVAPEVDALADLMARRPVPLAPSQAAFETTQPTETISLDAGSDSEKDPGTPDELPKPREPVSIEPVFDRGTAAQERQLLIDMGLLSADAPYHGAVATSAFEKVVDVSDDDENENEAVADKKPDNASRGQADVASSRVPVSPGAVSARPIDPRREELLSRMNAAAADRRETKTALRANKQKMAAEQASADERARQNREAEEAERQRRKR
jgi:hypothetical protein